MSEKNKKSEEELKEMAKEMAALMKRNIRDVTTAITMNIDYDKKHTVLAAYGALYSVCSYFEIKLNSFGIIPDAIQKAKDGADQYVLDVVSAERNTFPIDKGEA